ncbi:MAG: stage III sporulation protein AG [Velocimicrobium sp.]
MAKKKLTLKEIGMDKIIIIFCTGIFLLILSVPSLQKDKDDTSNSDTTIMQTSQTSNVSSKSTNSEYIEWTEKRLEDTLSEVEGIGAIKVMITLKESSEKVALKDSPYSQENSSESDGSGGSRVSSSATREDETVMISEQSGESSPYIIKEVEPQVEGVLVLASGATNSETIEEIVGAVQVLFDVPVHKIKVMKMESRSK